MTTPGITVVSDCMVSPTMGGYLVQGDWRNVREPRDGCSCDVCTSNRVRLRALAELVEYEYVIERPRRETQLLGTVG